MDGSIKGAGKKSSLAVHLRSDDPLGQVLYRGAKTAVPGRRLKVILRRDPEGSTGFRILTVKICP